MTTNNDVLERHLFGPGPTNVSTDVRQALARPTIGHLDPAFLDIMDEVSQKLRKCMLTDNALTFVMSAPGSIGMETGLVNLIEPGEKVIVCINGVFGGRMTEICTRLGANVVEVVSKWGIPVDLEKLKVTLESNNDAVAVAFVHAETSTGVLSDAKAIADLAHQYGCLVVADCVTSLAGVELRLDDWSIDIAYSGSQKCLSCVPGLSPISFSPAAIEKIQARTSKPQSWFCDVSLLMAYYVAGDSARAYHHTAPVNSLFAIDAALDKVLAEGLEDRWQRHREAAEYLYDRLESLGLSLLVDLQNRLSPLTLVEVPEGIDDALVRQNLLEQHNLEIGAGLGEFAGKAWRIGLMGDNATKQNVDMVVGHLARYL